MTLHRTRRGALATLGLAALAPRALIAQAAADPDRLGRDVLAGTLNERRAALEAIARRGDPDMLASLILAMRFRPGDDLDAAAAAITGETRARGWFDWMLWQEGRPDIRPNPSFAALMRDVHARIDPAFLRFLRPEHVAPDAMEIRLEEITWGGVAVDGIPSLDDPARIPAAEADWLRGEDLVFGVEVDGDARAYPLRIMGWHEMFNETVGGVPLALAYCTLCGAGILFERRVAGRAEPFVFGSSGFLYRSNKLMFDRQTDSLWNQFTGRPVVGPLVGSGIELRQRPVVITEWRRWRDANPDTTVLSLDTGHRRDYGPGVVYRDYFASPDLMFPAMTDERHLRKKDDVFGVRVPLAAKAWPLAAFAGGRVINDGVGALPLVLSGDGADRSVRAYERGDRRFEAAAEGLRDQDGRLWRVTEAVLVGPGGARLARVAGHVSYWFAWNGYLGVESELWRE